MSLSPLVEDPTPTESGPLPLSLPAILRNPKPAIPAHLHQPQRMHHRSTPASAKPIKRVEGRRARLRRENDALAFNPHAYPPTRSEIATLYLPNTKPTFPSPLPAHLLPRTRPAPSPPPPTADPRSGDAGQYGMSLTGVRRQLRSKGARAEALVQLVEAELDGWVANVRQSVVLLPARQSRDRRVVDPFLVGREGGAQTEAIIEVSRGSASLIWEIGASFERFVVHCVARHHNLVSFSKSTADGKRQTHILLPPSRSTHGRSSAFPSSGSLDTPPTTDLSSLNGSGTDTDAGPAGLRGATGDQWGSWDSESENESPQMLAPLIRALALNSEDPVDQGDPDAYDLSDAPHIQSYETDETSDDESVSSAALSSLANSLANLPPATATATTGGGVPDRLLPHRPERPSPAFVPTPAADTDSEVDDAADRTFTPASFAPRTRTLKAEVPPTSFWAYVYA